MLGRSGKFIVSSSRSDEYSLYLRKMIDKMRDDAYEAEKPFDHSSATTDERESSKVVSVNFLLKENAKKHNTNQFSLVHTNDGPLIIRRGQDFMMEISFLERTTSEDFKIKLELGFGHEPNSDKGSRVILEVTDNSAFLRDKAQWDVRRGSVEADDKMPLRVQVPPTIGIGVWTITVILSPRKSGRKVIKIFKNVYILFNPWCEDDTVYLKTEKLREEYVLADVGKLYFGTHDQYTSRRWVYGQYTPASLPASMYCLDLSGLRYNARSNPVLVSRAISNMTNKSANVKGDKGVIVGKWGKENDDYADGTPPWSWTGSSPILEQFLKKKGRPVKYGQCWVFAGVATTICRALGIPSRNVTCFIAGHDTDETLTIDITFDSGGHRMPTTNDSIWNFHVWTEVYMARYDLPTGYGGWQVIDGTPQELSDGTYQLGPCPVLAVKKGEVGLLYDTLFVFSEVNADMISWTMKENGMGFDKAATNTDHIGRLVITKKAGVYDHHGETDVEDLTSHYKFKEGTAEERMAVLSASRNAAKSLLFDMPENHDVVFELEPIVNVMTGEPFDMCLNIENVSSKTRTIKAVLCSCSVLYNGVVCNMIKKKKFAELTVEGNQKLDIKTTVDAKDYVEQLVEFGMIKFYGMARVKETDQPWAGELDFLVKKPKLGLEFPNEVKVGKSYVLRVKLKNPYKVSLTECKFSIEGPGLVKYTHVDVKDVGGNLTVVQEFPVVPTYKCDTAIVAVFVSNELTDISGSKRITVLK